MIISKDKKNVIVGCYKILNQANEGKERLKLVGLDINETYELSYPYKKEIKGDELMNIGVSVDNKYFCNNGKDFSSVLYTLKKL